MRLIFVAGTDYERYDLLKGVKELESTEVPNARRCGKD